MIDFVSSQPNASGELGAVAHPLVDKVGRGNSGHFTFRSTAYGAQYRVYPLDIHSAVTGYEGYNGYSKGYSMLCL